MDIQAWARDVQAWSRDVQAIATVSAQIQDGRIWYPADICARVKFNGRNPYMYALSYHNKLITALMEASHIPGLIKQLLREYTKPRMHKYSQVAVRMDERRLSLANRLLVRRTPFWEVW